MTVGSYRQDRITPNQNMKVSIHDNISMFGQAHHSTQMKHESIRVADSSEGPSALNIPVKAPASYNTQPTEGKVVEDVDY